MAHVRKQLRDYLKPRLAASPDAGGRCYVQRTYPLGKDVQPSFLLSVENERSEDVSMGGTQERTISIRIVAVAKGDQEADENLLDAMAVFTEAVFSGDPTFGGLASDYEYKATEFSSGSVGEKVLSVAALTFAVTLLTSRGDPQTSLG